MTFKHISALLPIFCLPTTFCQPKTFNSEQTLHKSASSDQSTKRVRSCSIKRTLRLGMAVGCLSVPSLLLSLPAHACQLPKSYYKHVSCTADSRYFLAVKDSGQPVALINNKGKRAVDLMRYTQVDASLLSAGLMPVQRGNKVGYVSVTGREVIPTIYQPLSRGAFTKSWARPVSEGRIVVKKNGQFGVIDTRNKTVIPFSRSYKTISNYDAGVAKVIKSNATTWVDVTGKSVPNPNAPKQTLAETKTPEPKSPQSIDTALEALLEKERSTVLDESDSMPYDSMQSIEIWQPVQRDGQWGYVNQKGVPMITFSFTQALPFSEGLAAVRLNNKWGFINLAGELVIPFQFIDFSSAPSNASTQEKPNQQDKLPFVFDNGKAWVGKRADNTLICIDNQAKPTRCND